MLYQCLYVSVTKHYRDALRVESPLKDKAFPAHRLYDPSLHGYCRQRTASGYILAAAMTPVAPNAATLVGIGMLIDTESMDIFPPGST